MEIPRVDDWLNQFDIADRYLAAHLLKKMRYVSFEEVEQWLQVELKKLLDDIQQESGNKEAIAIFPVAKPFIHQFNEDKEVKPQNDSAGRIGHALKNLERQFPKHIELSPRLESMRARKVRHIIFVDDFIGTGDRFISSWQKMVSKSVKSWCSHGWCKIWVLAFAGHQPGVRRILRKVKAVDNSRIRINLRIERSFIAENDSFRYLIEKYSQNLPDGNKGLGYGGLLSPIVFQHGCPNNVASIFWSERKVRRKRSKSKQERWTPLFPKRSVPHDLYPLFSLDLTKESMAEEIWMSGNYKLALELIDRLENFRGEHQLLVILAYLAKNKDIDKIRNTLVLTDAEFQELLTDLTTYGLIEDQNRVTKFGRDVLARFSRASKETAICYDGGINFYPATFLGFQREV